MNDEEAFEAGAGDIQIVAMPERKTRDLGKPNGQWYPWMDEFLEKLQGEGTVGDACTQMGEDSPKKGEVKRKHVYLHAQKCKQFKEAWHKTFHRAAPDRLEESVWQRAIKGTQIPIIAKGVIIAYRTQHHDHLAEMLLKSAFPERYMVETAMGASGTHEDTAQALLDARARITKHMQSLKPNGTNGDEANRLN